MTINTDLVCSSLFAHLYIYYKDPKTSEVSAGLPQAPDFTLSRKFDTIIGRCLVRINSLLRPHLRPIFKREFLTKCRSEEAFLKFIESLYKDLKTEHETELFLIICAFVSELNLFCFQRGCFRYANFAPECLRKVFGRNLVTAAAFEEYIRFAKGEFKIYEALRELTSRLFEDMSANRRDEPLIVKAVCDVLKERKDAPIVDVRSELDDSTEVSAGEEDKLLGATAIFPPDGQDNCSVCDEKMCDRYFRVFVLDYLQLCNRSV